MTRKQKLQGVTCAHFIRKAGKLVECGKPAVNVANVHVDDFGGLGVTAETTMCAGCMERANAAPVSPYQFRCWESRNSPSPKLQRDAAAWCGDYAAGELCEKHGNDFARLERLAVRRFQRETANQLPEWLDAFAKRMRLADVSITAGGNA